MTKSHIPKPCMSVMWAKLIAWCSLQAESECDEQSTTDQATQAKMKNAFISQNVSSLQELGE